MGSHRLRGRIVICTTIVNSSPVDDHFKGSSRYGKKLLVNLLQSVDPLLELNVIGRKLCLKHWSML